MPSALTKYFRAECLAALFYLVAIMAWLLPKTPVAARWGLLGGWIVCGIHDYRQGATGLTGLSRLSRMLIYKGGLLFHGLWILLLILWLWVRVAQWNSFGFSLWTLGLYSNVVTNTMHGNFLYSSILGFNHLGTHFSPIILIFIPFYALAGNDPRILMLAQVVTAGVTVPLLFWLGRDVIGQGRRATAWAAACALAFMLYQPMLSAVVHDFHPSTLMAPFIILALLNLRRRNNVWLMVNVAVLLCCKESAALVLVSLALYAWLELGRRRMALVLSALALAQTVGYFGVIQPLLGPGNWQQVSRVQPGDWLSGKFNLMRLTYLVRLFWPVAFIPLFQWRWVAWIAPQVLLNLITNYPPQLSALNHYDDGIAPLVFVAVLHYLATARPTSIPAGPLKRRLTVGVIAALAWTTLLASGGSPLIFLRHFKSRTAYHKVSKALQPYRQLTYDQPIRAPGRLAVLVCNRREVSHLQTQLSPSDFQSGSVILLSPALENRSDRSFKESRGLIDQYQDRLETLQRDQYLWAFYVRPAIGPAGSSGGRFKGAR